MLPGTVQHVPPGTVPSIRGFVYLFLVIFVLALARADDFFTDYGRLAPYLVLVLADVYQFAQAFALLL
jgi:hypothetical protein